MTSGQPSHLDAGALEHQVEQLDGGRVVMQRLLVCRVGEQRRWGGEGRGLAEIDRKAYTDAEINRVFVFCGRKAGFRGCLMLLILLTSCWHG